MTHIESVKKIIEQDGCCEGIECEYCYYEGGDFCNKETKTIKEIRQDLKRIEEKMSNGYNDWVQENKNWKFKVKFEDGYNIKEIIDAFSCLGLKVDNRDATRYKAIGVDDGYAFQLCYEIFDTYPYPEVSVKELRYLLDLDKRQKNISIFTDNSDARKTFPVWSGLMTYFPDAFAALAHLSWKSAKKHNDGVLGWRKDISNDHVDCLVRHMFDYFKTGDIEELKSIAWRANAWLQIALEKEQEQK